MLLVVCIFLVLAVLGTNLLNTANANIFTTKTEYDKEQTMLYVSSIYDIVNEMIEDGKFSDAWGNLPAEAETSAAQPFYDGDGKEIKVKVKFVTDTLPFTSYIVITARNAQGSDDTYSIKSTYSKASELGKYKRESCKGLIDNALVP